MPMLKRSKETARRGTKLIRIFKRRKDVYLRAEASLTNETDLN